MTDVAEETYFNKEYLGATLWYGIGIINALANLGMLMYLPQLIQYYDYPREHKYRWKGNPDNNWWTR